MLLAGCSTLTPSGAAQLAALSPLTADPAGLEVALVLPPGLEVAPGSARMMIEAVRTSTGEVRRGDYVLAMRDGDPASLGEDVDGRLSFFAIAPQDVADMRDFLAEVAAWKAFGLDDDTRGSLSLGLGGCGTGLGPAPDATGSVYVRTTVGGSFVPLLRDASIRDLIGPEAFDRIRPCG